MWSIVTVIRGRLTVLHMTDGCVVYKMKDELLKKEERPADKGKDDGHVPLVEKETTT